MALTSEKDSYGNIWDSRGFWVGVGENEGEIYSSALGRWISTYDPQADYIMGQPEPKAAPTGGGGSTNPSTIFINNNPGQLKIQKTATAGDGTGFPPGTVYQEDQVTGATTILYKPSTSTPASLYNDTNNDGYDDQSGLPVGVVASSKSPSGFFYQGKAVNADGSLYQGGDGSGAPQLVNGKYIWDGTKFVVAPGMESTSGSSNISVSGIKSSSSGGGGSSSYNAGSERDYAGEDAANDARRAAENALDREFRAGESALDRALRLQESAASNAQRQEDRRLAAVDAYGKGLTSYDAKAYFDGLQAAGYDINNLLRSGTNLLTNEALTPSAAALGIIRGGVANSGLPATPGVPVGTGEGTATSSVPGQPATSGLPPVASSGPTNPDGTPNMAWQIANQKAKDEAAKQAAHAVRSGWEPVSTGAGIVYREFKDGQPTGKQMSQAEYNTFQQRTNPMETGNPSAQEQIINAIQMAQEKQNAYQQVQDWTQPAQNVSAGKTTATGGGETVYNMPWGWSATNQMPVMPGAGGSAQGPTDEPGGTVGVAEPFVQPRAVMALARGGVANSGLAVVGDSVSGRPTGHEELVIDPTGDSTVVPLNRQGLQAARGLPRFALGGSMQRTGTSVWDTASTRTDSGSMVGMPTATTTPTAPRRTAPVATTGLPPSVPVTQPATQPVTQPVTQPAATQPVTQPVIPGASAANSPVVPAAPPAASGVPAQQPVASSGLPVTPPPDQALLDEIAQKRRDTILMGGPSPYSLKWGGMSDLYKQTYAENQAQKYGVPAEEIIWQGQQRKGLGGVALSGLSTLGY